MNLIPIRPSVSVSSLLIAWAAGAQNDFCKEITHLVIRGIAGLDKELESKDGEKTTLRGFFAEAMHATEENEGMEEVESTFVQAKRMTGGRVSMIFYRKKQEIRDGVYF